MKRKATDCEKIFSDHIFNKERVSKHITKNFQNTNNKRTIPFFQEWQIVPAAVSPKIHESNIANYYSK